MGRMGLMGLMLLGCLGAWGASLEDLRAALDGADVAGVREVTAIIVKDGDGNPAEERHPFLTGWRVASIYYVVVEGDVVVENTVAVLLDNFDVARWRLRPPSVLAAAAVGPEPVGTEAELLAAVASAGGAKLQKVRIAHGDGYAEVTGLLEVEGELVEYTWHVTEDGQGGLEALRLKAEASAGAR